jgi:hypothetical protein
MDFEASKQNGSPMHFTYFAHGAHSVLSAEYEAPHSMTAKAAIVTMHIAIFFILPPFRQLLH